MKFVDVPRFFFAGKLANSIWGTAIGVALLFGCAVGFVARPYVFTHVSPFSFCFEYVDPSTTISVNEKGHGF